LAFATFLVWRLRIGACGFRRLWQLPILIVSICGGIPFFVSGVVFAVLSVADSAVPLLSGPLYSQVYNATVDVYPAAFYWVTVASQAILFLFIL